MIYSKDFIVLALIVLPLMHLELNLVSSVDQESNIILLHTDIQLSQYYLLKNILSPTDLHWCSCQTWIDHKRVYFQILKSIAMALSFEIKKCESSNFIIFQGCFFFYSGSLIFPYKFQDQLVKPYKRVTQYFVRESTTLQISLGSTAMLTISSLPICGYEMSFQYLGLKFFQQSFCSFQCLTLLC